MKALSAIFTSKKFFLSILGIVAAFVLMGIGALSVEAGVKAILQIVTVYLGVEGAADLASRFGIRELVEKFLSGLFKKKEVPEAK